jgi:hypothetical protein
MAGVTMKRNSGVKFSVDPLRFAVPVDSAIQYTPPSLHAMSVEIQRDIALIL